MPTKHSELIIKLAQYVINDVDRSINAFTRFKTAISVIEDTKDVISEIEEVTDTLQSFLKFYKEAGGVSERQEVQKELSLLRKMIVQLNLSLSKFDSVRSYANSNNTPKLLILKLSRILINKLIILAGIIKTFPKEHLNANTQTLFSKALINIKLNISEITKFISTVEKW